MRRSAVLLSILLGLALVACSGGRRGGGGGGGGDDDSSPDDDDTGDDDDDGAPGGPVDVLLVVDNSASMERIQSEIRVEFPSLLSALVAADVDFQLGVTTLDFYFPGNGYQGNIRSASALGGGDCQTPQLLTPGSAGLESAFDNLVDVGTGGGGDELGLYAAAIALCKAQDKAFWDGLTGLDIDDPRRQVCGVVPPVEQQCNQGFLRAGASPVIIVVTDEGDGTGGLDLPPLSWLDQCVLEYNDDPFFGECDCRLMWWLEFFEALAPGTSFVTIGPTYQSSDWESPWCDGSKVTFPGPCNEFGSSVCTIDFYQDAACLTGGLFMPVESTVVPGDPSSCDVSDFGLIAADLTAFLGG